MTTEVLNEERLLATVGGDLELLAEIARLFLEDSVEMQERLRAALEREDDDALFRAAHWAKGSVANFAADRAVALGLEVEEMARSDGAAAATAKVEQLLAELDRVRVALQSYC
ncbi:MAG: Hpt domain-containing protein [Acidobacteriota bacterium]